MSYPSGSQCLPKETAAVSLFLFVVLPLAFAAVGKLLGCAVAASFFYSARGKRLGGAVGRWSMLGLPLAYLAVMMVGAGGNAGHGMTLLGSDTLFEVVCGAPYYAIPLLAAFAGAMYVLRDLTVGQEKVTSQ
jgi:hypothetical protein